MAEKSTLITEDKIQTAKGAVTFTRTVDKGKWEEEFGKAEKSLLANVKVPGFRPGKAPLQTAKRYVSRNQVIDRAVQAVLADMHRTALTKKEIKEARLFSGPRPSVLKLDEDGMVACLTFDLAPSVTLKQYKGLPVKIQKAVVSEEELAAEIDRIVSRQSMRLIKDGAADNGDVVTIDFEGFLDGKPFAGGKADGHDLVLGSKSFIPGFEDQLVGKKAGEAVDVHVTFPEHYHAKDLAGKKVVFKVQVKQVKQVQKAVLDDALVASFDIPSVKTAEQFKKYVSEQLFQQKQLNLDSAANDALLKALDQQVTADVPLSLIHSEEGKLMESLKNGLKDRKLSFEEYLKRENMTNEQLHDRMHADAERNVRLSLALQEIVALEKIAVTEAEVEDHLSKVAKLYNMPLAEVKKIIANTEQIKGQILNDKVFRFLREHAA